MLKIDGTKGQDVTSVFLLVSRDVTPPVLTLSDPVFFADRETGAYTITGMADAGSEILYGGTEKIYANSKGHFAVPGTLDENSGILSLSAKDSAGNLSAQQLALITRQTRYAVTVNGKMCIRDSGTGAMHVVCGNVYGGVLRPVWDSRPLRAACLFALLCLSLIHIS